MRKLFTAFILFISCTVPAVCVGQTVLDIDLWPGGLPNSNGVDNTQPFNFETQNFKPNIKVFLPAKELATGRAVVACPGGSYLGLAIGHEGNEWAKFFNDQGVALVVLTYRMPKGGHREVPLSDAVEALRVVRANAQQWNINPADVGIMGFSAGGHLASTVATHTEPPICPAFQILFYPVISMEENPMTHKGSRDNLLGDNASPDLMSQYSNYNRVTANTPRAFIAYSDDDTAVPPLNGTKYYEALKQYNIPASLHIYPSGGHGWGCRESFKYHNQMIEDLQAWLNSF